MMNDTSTDLMFTSTQKEVNNEDKKSIIYTMDNDKNALQELNDRLACYVDTIRKSGDTSLSINSKHESSIESSHIESIKKTYENELEKSRGIIEKEGLEILELRKSIKTVCENRDDLTNELNRSKNELKSVTSKLETAIETISKKDYDLCKTSNSLSVLKNEVHKKDDEICELAKKLNASDKLLNDMESKYHNTLCKYEHVTEKHQFEIELAREELDSAYKCIDELKRRLSSDQNNTYDDLGSLRLELSEELENAKQNVLGDMTAKIKELEKEVAELSDKLIKMTDDKNITETLLKNKIMELETEKSKTTILDCKIQAMANEYDTKIENLQRDLKLTQVRHSEVQEKLHSLMFDYEAVVGKRISLENELSAYNKILESEERRLHITPRKRAYNSPDSNYVFRVLLTNKLCFDIPDIQSANYIKLKSENGKARTFSNCKLRISSGGDETLYSIAKLHVPSHGDLTIYSNSHSTEREEPFLIIDELSCFVINHDVPTVITIFSNKSEVLCECEMVYVDNSFYNTPTVKRTKTLSALQSPRFNKTPLRSRTTLQRVKKDGDNVANSCRIC